jgi:signal transduction histidine kinase
MNRNKKILLSLCFLIVCTIVSIELFNYSTNTFNQTKKRVQNKILNFEKNSISFAEDFFVNNNDDSLSFIENNIFTNYSTVLIYIDSSLVFWSNNESNYPIVFSTLQNNSIYYTNNSINYSKKYEDKNIILITLLPLKNTYNIENQYINNKINSYFKISEKFDFNFSSSTNNEGDIFNSEKDFIFSINYKNNSSLLYCISETSSILFIFLICIILYYFLFFSLNSNNHINTKRKILFGILITIALRLLSKFICSFSFFCSPIFNKKFSNIYFLLDNPGDLLISSFFFLLIIIFIFNIDKKEYNSRKKPLVNVIFYLIFMIIILLCFFIINKIFIISTTDIVFLQLSKTNIFSILIYLSILLTATSIIIISSNLIFRILNKETNKVLSPVILSIVFVISILLTVLFNNSNNKKEEINAKLIANDNIFIRNSLVEQTLSWILSEFKNDSLIYNLSMNNLIQNENSIYLNNLINEHFNYGYLSKYYVKYIIADSATTIQIDNDTNIYNCNNYFNWFTENYGIKTLDNNLNYIRDLHDVPYYIYHLKTKNYDIWFDIIPKYNLEGIGYSEILSTPESQLYSINLSKYSIGIYIDNYLIRSIGKYSYKDYVSEDEKSRDGDYYYVEHGYKHFVFKNKTEDDLLIIISKSYSIITYIFSVFSLIFICLLFVYFLSCLIVNFFSQQKSFGNTSLKQKIQNSSIIFFIIISLIIGIFSISLVISLNNNKNEDILIEKTHSLSKELAQIINYSEDQHDYLNEILVNLSGIHFLDINVYDQDGFLIGTSNEEMLLNNISSSLINIDAFQNLQNNNRFLHKENIGSYTYLSSYMVFSDKNDKIYFLNIPYFTKQVELQNEIRNYIISFINLYLIIIIVAIIMTYILSRFITRPLGMLKDKLSSLSLQKTNEKIDYIQDDEIGKLVEVYNLKVDELEKSVNLLSKSERESAWREMAKQIAHEIKNPLTPMKLSTQYIYKLWKEDQESFDKQIEKYKETMISQIDSLSEIATAFSNFANLPEAKNEKLNIIATINQIIDFYNQINIKIILHSNEENIFIYADQNLITRVFHNLIRNSIQAFKNEKEPEKVLKIDINTYINDSSVIIEIQDNGPGISNKMKTKIFLPNFTTKSGGTGLGLAIVKNIIEGSGGEIYNLHSENGALFQIILPLLK